MLCETRYIDFASLIEEINNLECFAGHIRLKLLRVNYVAIARAFNSASSKIKHVVRISETSRKILGFDNGHIDRLFRFSPDTDQGETTGDRPANHANVLPNALLMYTDIIKPYVAGDVQARLLRSVDLGVDRYINGNKNIKSCSNPMYLPLLLNAFQTIKIDIRCHLGNPILFDFGLLAVTLYFKRIDLDGLL